MRGDLYDADFDFAIDKISVRRRTRSDQRSKDVHYVVDTDDRRRLHECRAQAGLGSVKSKELDALGLELEEVHYDFTVRRLHVETLEKLMADIKAIVREADRHRRGHRRGHDRADQGAWLELLKYDPEFVIDRIGIVTPDGDGYIKGVIKLKGVDRAGSSTVGAHGADRQARRRHHASSGRRSWSRKSRMARPAPARPSTPGYAKREGDKLVSHIEFQEGRAQGQRQSPGNSGTWRPPPQPKACRRRSRIAASIHGLAQGHSRRHRDAARRAAARST